MEQTFLSEVVLPLALATIMLGMGLSLVLDDFKRVFRVPKAVAIGLLCQMVLLPLVGFAVVKLVAMDSPALAVGLLVLTFCPGGATSNMLTLLARGDVALSITLTAVTSLITPFSIPILTNIAAAHLMAEGQAVVIPFSKSAGLFVITVVPVLIGMAIRKRWPDAADKADKPVKVVSLLFLFGIIAALIKQNAAELPGFFAQTGVATLILNVTTIALGYGAARLAKLSRPQQTTIGIEVGIQNGTLALFVTGSLIGNTTMTIAPAIYSLIMFGTGGIFGYLANLGGGESQPDAGVEA
ncbi:MAG: bile acid:sodium symporter family protein [Polyangiaceae bacterium]